MSDSFQPIQPIQHSANAFQPVQPVTNAFPTPTASRAPVSNFPPSSYETPVTIGELSSQGLTTSSLPPPDTVEAFSASLDAITNSGAPSTSTHTSDLVSSLAPSSSSSDDHNSEAFSLSLDAITNSGTPYTATKTSDVASSLAPTSSSNADHQHNAAEAHVDNLASALAGAVLSAPLAAVEALSPTVAGHLSTAGTTISTHATNLANKAGEYATSDQAKNYLDQATVHASNLAGKAGEFANSDTAKGYLNQASDAAARVTVQASDAASKGYGQAADVANRGVEDATQGSWTQSVGGLVHGVRDTVVNSLPTSVANKLPASLSGSTSTESAPTNSLTGESTASASTESPLVNEPSLASEAGWDTKALAIDPTATEKAKSYLSNEATASSSFGDKAAGVHTGLGTDTNRTGSQVLTETFYGSSTTGKSGKSVTDFAKDKYNDGLGSSGSNVLGSDAGHESFTDKLSSAAKPDSEKTSVEQATDYAKIKVEGGLSYLQPEGQKSTTQKASDAFGSNTTTSGFQ